LKQAENGCWCPNSVESAVHIPAEGKPFLWFTGIGVHGGPEYAHLSIRQLNELFRK
jgi:hypothetical protein